MADSGDNPATAGVLLKDLPQPLLEEIGDSLRHFLVPMVGLYDRDRPDALHLVGSGTLVTVGARSYVLTAAHVWKRANDFSSVSLTLTTDFLSWFPIPLEHLSAQVIQATTFTELGPDLALVALPSYAVGRIAAHKSFLNLSRQRNLFLSEPAAQADGRMYALAGVPQELSHITSDPDRRVYEANLLGGPFFGGIVNASEREGWDLVDMRANVELPGVPKTFGGLSGGSLWQVRLARSRTGLISWTGDRLLRGVAFWEYPVPDSLGELRIRSHGPRSLYETAWRKWSLPE